MSRQLFDAMKICVHFREEMFYTATEGALVLTGLRQSMPSSSIDSCARLNDTAPSSAFGQTKRPRSKRFANRQSPSPSHQSTLMRSPRLPRKTKTWPEYGFCSSTVCAAAGGKPGWSQIPTHGLGNANRDQLRGWCLRIETAFPIQLPPVEDLVRVNAMRARDHCD